ncbi:hypothetical protein [Mesorhizobium jarvisii]|uniref:hypothetical protein n=1 Tax=Mesorhizobium jarvisii TaxID=1777867 RepID=UPI000571E9C2|nr:hypothetical protein [Mesorhizobium jarvisii]MCH4559128.1 hypothetical protein [Mesorhizobium jarvisii]QGU20688.1 hypothetical protein MCHK_09150 [Mesorhizobium huakuii 7653R]
MNATEAAKLALAWGFRNSDEMRRSLFSLALGLVKGQSVQGPSVGPEVWKPLSTTAAGYATVPELHHSPEALERQRENIRRATEHATAYIPNELEKARARRERRNGRP